MRFKDREDAGDKLAEELKSRGIEADLVLAIPRGGLPLGRKVADALDADLDVVVASKIGAPGNPELAIGAVTSDGSYWLNQDLIDRMDVREEFIESGIDVESENARQKLEYIRGEDRLPEVKGKKIVVVDDGIATGSTAIACLRQLKNEGAGRIVLAVPVGPADIPGRLEYEADEIVMVAAPSSFNAVGAHYKDFQQVTDEEARSYLAR